MGLTNHLLTGMILQVFHIIAIWIHFDKFPLLWSHFPAVSLERESKIPTKNSLSILSRLQTEDLKLVGGFNPLEKY